jgi:hypothetical protein
MMAQRMSRDARNRRRSGHALVEFALVGVFLVPMFLGGFTVGMNLNHSVRVTQVVRDAGHMYARFVDFSLISNQDILVRLAEGMGMTRTGGSGVLILSKITFIGDDDCTGAGYALSGCANRNQYVITHRQVVGNSTLRYSAFGTPNSNSLDSSGNAIDVYGDASLRAPALGNLLTLSSGQFAFVAEGQFRGPGLDFGVLPEMNNVYTRAIF